MELRPATIEDAALLLKWRKDDETADWWTGQDVDAVEHVRWLWRRENCDAFRLFVAELDGVPVGQVRLDTNGEVSFSVDAQFRGRKLGARMLELVAEHAGEYGGRLKASVDATNLAGRATLGEAGFVHRPDVLFYLYRR